MRQALYLTFLLTRASFRSMRGSSEWFPLDSNFSYFRSKKIFHELWSVFLLVIATWFRWAANVSQVKWTSITIIAANRMANCLTFRDLNLQTITELTRVQVHLKLENYVRITILLLVGVVKKFAPKVAQKVTQNVTQFSRKLSKTLLPKSFSKDWPKSCQKSEKSCWKSCPKRLFIKLFKKLFKRLFKKLPKNFV